MNKGLIMTIGGLVVIVTVLAAVNINSLSNRTQITENPQLTITSDGEIVTTVTLDQMQELGAEEFTITLRSSGKPARDLVMTGIPLSAVLDKYGPSLSDKEQIIARAIDGYVVAYDIGELVITDHLFIVYRENGERLKSKAEGGSGPLLLVARQDEFGQRWCKFLVEVDIE